MPTVLPLALNFTKVVDNVVDVENTKVTTPVWTTERSFMGCSTLQDPVFPGICLLVLAENIRRIIGIKMHYVTLFRKVRQALASP